jgi:ferredoxin-NADP reductase
MNGKLLSLRVDSIKWELPDTATFYLSPTTSERVSYKAGQFITLVFDHHEHEIRRSYSLSSSPDEDLLAITVKRIDNGEISRFLQTKVKPGDILYAVQPAGRFLIADYEAEKDLFLFAGGSGIVPVFAQLKYILNRLGKSKLHLIYSSQSKASVIFANELNGLAECFPDRLNIIHMLSSDARRLNNIVVEQTVNRLVHFERDDAEFYLCGPFPYMRMISLTLHFMGIADKQIRKENFVLETVPVTGTMQTYPPKNIRINFGGEEHNLVEGENQSILQTALQNNIQLPYSCRHGICSACLAFCETGKVEMAKNEVLTEAELAAGWILTCTGHALTDDVVISYK